MNAFTPTELPDVQATRDVRGHAIQRVGIRGVTHPVMVQTGQGVHASIAQVEMYVSLPADQKGTHMSRFVEILNGLEAPLESSTLPLILHAMLERLESEGGFLSFRMPVFLRKAAPVSGIESLMDYDMSLRAEQVNGAAQVELEVTTPVTSLCPCSKTISRYGAHNQRSHVTIAVTLTPGARMMPDELIAIAEAAASCELWGLLKRADEKYVTERAYENPKFVEDLVRDVAAELASDPRVLRYQVASENFESIHNHSAYARIEGVSTPAA